PRLARQDAGAVHPHAARATDHHPAALTVRERPVVSVLDDVEDVEKRHPLRCLDLVFGERPSTGFGVEAPELQRYLPGPLAPTNCVLSSVSLAGGSVILTGALKSWKRVAMYIVSCCPLTSSVKDMFICRTSPSSEIQTSTGN